MSPANAFVTEAFTLLSVAILAIGLRSYARWSTFGFRNLAFDDFLMLFSGVIYSLETGAAYTVGARFFGLANNGMTDLQRETLDPHSHEWTLRVGGSKTQLVGWSLYTLLLWSLKLCMAIFYSRLTEGLYLTTKIRIAYGAIGVTYIATILSILFGCHPFSKNWQINPDPGNACQPAISKINLYVTVVLNVVTDMYLMSIPLPLMWNAILPLKRKLLLLGMFGGGVFVMAAGVLRCALIIADPVNGAQQAGSWACRETFVAVVIGNIPMIYPLFVRTVSKVSNSVFSSGVASTGKGSNGDVSIGPKFQRPSKPARRKKNPFSINLSTLGGTTIGGTTLGNNSPNSHSTEHIVGPKSPAAPGNNKPGSTQQLSPTPSVQSQSIAISVVQETRMDISAADAEEGRRMDRNGQGQEPLPTFEGGYIKKQHGPGHGYTVNVARGQ